MTRRSMLIPTFTLFLAACTTADVDTPAQELPCEDPTCVQPGVNDFVTPQGLERELHVFMPDDPVGAPVMFVWHHLTGTPEELLGWMPLEQATEDGFIVVAPVSRGLVGTEWDLVSPPGTNEDIQLFDAVLDDLIARYDADPFAYSTGFSAGGLYSTLLTMHRSERLAASAPFSGGTPAQSYVTPREDVPVMLTWGGPTDAVYGFDFDAATLFAAQALHDDGHPVWVCEHALGHWLPADATSRTLAFFAAIRSGGAVAFESCDEVR